MGYFTHEFHFDKILEFSERKQRQQEVMKEAEGTGQNQAENVAQAIIIITIINSKRRNKSRK